VRNFHLSKREWLSNLLRDQVATYSLGRNGEFRQLMERRLELDAARGFMLVWMTLTHLPTIASVVTNQPFGFVSAAEGFIFLSALFSGRVYFRLAKREGYPEMRAKLWMRTLRLYLYHALLLSFAFLVDARIAAHGNRPGLHNLLDFYFAAGPRQAIVDAALLIYRPPLLDILPMYIFFLLLTPVVLTVISRVGWKAILGASFAVWLAAQFGLRVAAYNFLVHTFGLQIPLNEMGSFDLWAWQFLWTIGLYCGVCWAKHELPAESWAKRVLIPAAVLVPLLLVLRYKVGHGIELGMFEVSFDKWHLGVVRLINFAAIAALLIRFQSAIKPLVARPLVMMGQSSLQVFCAHLLFCFLGLTIMGDASRVTGWEQVALLAATFFGLLLTAKIFARSEAKTEGSSDRGMAIISGGNSVAIPGVTPIAKAR
jgi:hypothetical protein